VAKASKAVTIISITPTPFAFDRRPAKRRDQLRDLRRVINGPIRLRQQVVDHVDAPGVQQSECDVEMSELSRPCICKDQVKSRCTIFGLKNP
jgi:hypothetical protein